MYLPFGGQKGKLENMAGAWGLGPWGATFGPVAVEEGLECQQGSWAQCGAAGKLGDPLGSPGVLVGGKPDYLGDSVAPGPLGSWEAWGDPLVEAFDGTLI